MVPISQNFPAARPHDQGQVKDLINTTALAAGALLVRGRAALAKDVFPPNLLPLAVIAQHATGQIQRAADQDACTGVFIRDAGDSGHDIFGG